MGNRCENGLHSRWRPASLGSGGGSPWGSPGGLRRRSSYGVPTCSYGQGSVRAASGTTLGVLGTSKMRENERFHGFTDFSGNPARRGRDGHGPKNQVTAGTESRRLPLLVVVHLHHSPRGPELAMRHRHRIDFVRAPVNRACCGGSAAAPVLKVVK